MKYFRGQSRLTGPRTDTDPPVSCRFLSSSHKSGRNPESSWSLVCFGSLVWGEIRLKKGPRQKSGLKRNNVDNGMERWTFFAFLLQPLRTQFPNPQRFPRRNRNTCHRFVSLFRKHLSTQQICLKNLEILAEPKPRASPSMGHCLLFRWLVLFLNVYRGGSGSAPPCFSFYFVLG